MYAELVQILCKRCGIRQSRQNFYDKLHKEARCKKCVSEIRKAKYLENKEEVIARVKKYRDANPEKIRDYKLKQAYGVGIEYFDSKLAEQNGVCAICKCDRKVLWRGKAVRMALDHDHNSNEPRGILCLNCNRALGLLEEDPERMKNMIDYINKHKKQG